jgi:hypothetical protein
MIHNCVYTACSASRVFIAAKFSMEQPINSTKVLYE